MPSFEERRGTQRYPLDHLAKIQFTIDTPPLYCIVTDTSDGGVRINFNVNGFDIPDELTLLLSGDGPAQEGKYRVIWRRDTEVGAKLVSGH
jgi:PilZ domain